MLGLIIPTLCQSVRFVTETSQYHFPEDGAIVPTLMELYEALTVLSERFPFAVGFGEKFEFDEVTRGFNVAKLSVGWSMTLSARATPFVFQ